MNENHDDKGLFASGGGGGGDKGGGKDRGRGVKSFADRIARNNNNIAKTHAAMDKNAATASAHTKTPASEARQKRISQYQHDTQRAIADNPKWADPSGQKLALATEKASQRAWTPQTARQRVGGTYGT